LEVKSSEKENPLKISEKLLYSLLIGTIQKQNRPLEEEYVFSLITISIRKRE